jgi:hypothetical protein
MKQNYHKIIHELYLTFIAVKYPGLIIIREIAAGLFTTCLLLIVPALILGLGLHWWAFAFCCIGISSLSYLTVLIMRAFTRIMFKRFSKRVFNEG